MTTRLHHRIYVSLLAVALFGIGGTAIVTHTLFDPGFGSPHDSRLLAEAQFVARALNGVADERLPAEVERIGNELRLDLLVIGANDGVLASSGTIASSVLSAPRGLPHAGAHWLPTRHGRALVVAIDGQRRLAAWPRGNRPNVVLILAVFFGLLALGCMLVARRLTRRLEALEQGVARLGSGQLSTRVPVQGQDEIARLAERFNWSAERIERLVDAQRRMLLSASHELRSPLARVRVALELIRDRGGAEVERRVAGAVVDIDELDALVDDLLLASRIEIEPPLAAAETIDLASLVAEEAARAGAKLDVAPASVMGDLRLLRRLVRNLLDNAVRHGAGAEIEAGVAPLGGPNGGARLWVADRGPGVALTDRERIFEAFYRGARAPADASGVGIGLALVRQIAERHGGTAVCHPRDGGGAIFEVTLPNRSASE